MLNEYNKRLNLEIEINQIMGNNFRSILNLDFETNIG